MPGANFPGQTGPTGPRAATPRVVPERENIFLNLACNIVLPGLILSRLSADDRLGPMGALLLGISFPLGYGIYDLIVRRKWNFFSIVGLASVSLTGGFAMMKLDGFWFAVKEASIPTLFGVAILATIGTGRPLVREFILNESVIDVARLDEGLEARGTRARFDELLRRATWWMSGSFAMSAVLNFVLARVLLKSPSGTPEFTAELGYMTWLSWPVIALPSMILTMVILWRLLAGIRELTGLEMEDLLHGHHGEEPGRTGGPSQE
ncbi:MAG: VC0807 family protein [Candidatus Binatia bacterium]